MKIIFSNYDTLNNPFYAGGGAHAIHSVAKRLAKKHTVTVLCGSFPGSKNEVHDLVFYQRVGFTVGHPQIDQLIFHFSLPWNVIKRSFDVWIESFTPPFSTAFLPWFTNKPIIGVTHLLGGKEMSDKYHLPFYIIEKLGLRQYKYIIGLSTYLVNQVKDSGTKAETFVIPNGLDGEIINKSFDKSEEFILSLGRIDFYHKGLDILLPAYKKISESTNFNLVIAGSGIESEVRKLKAMIKRLGLMNRVKLLGKVDDIHKWDLYEKAVFTLFPSRVEGFAIVALEAMRSKNPLIISNIQGLRWVPDEASIKISSFNPDEYAEAMLFLLNNPEKRKIMGEAGHVAVKNYDWDLVSEQYEQVVNKVINV